MENTRAQKLKERSPFGFNVMKYFVLNAVKKKLGLDNIEQMYFGAAPMKQKTSDFYAQMAMPVVGLYGLSETSATATIQEFPLSKQNTEGMPLPGSIVKIFDADEEGIGEVCMRGRNVFMGYLGKEKSTWDVFDTDGFFHSGD